MIKHSFLLLNNKSAYYLNRIVLEVCLNGALRVFLLNNNTFFGKDFNRTDTGEGNRRVGKVF
jgi:hypothetical protein